MGDMIKVELLKAGISQRFGRYVHVSMDKAISLERKGIGRIIGSVHDITEGSMKLADMTNRAPMSFNPDSNSKLRIAWVQDLSKYGGAELSNETVKAVGRTLGYEIVDVTPSRYNLSAIVQADVCILNNLFEFGSSRLQGIIREIIERGIPFFKYDHDYRELKRTSIARSLFNRAVKNFFISPLHLQRYAEKFGELTRSNGVVLPLAIDTKHFQNRNGTRKDAILIMSGNKQKRGLLEYISKTENRKKSYVMVGHGPEFPGYAVRRIAKVPYPELPKLYNQHKTVLLKYDTEEPGSRIYFEARLCGCEVLVNEKVGHTSWGFGDHELVDRLTEAPIKFWQEIEAAAK